MKMKKTMFTLAVGIVLCGCQYVRTGGCDDELAQSETLAAYLDLCRETSVGGKLDEEDRDDWMVGASITSWEREAKYKIVSADAKYLSFRAEEFEYNGGAHGNTRITVGTLDRKTGMLLRAADLISEDRREDVLAQLREGVIKQIGGKENLQGEVKIVDNCFVAKDGIHFVYNEYEVACYAAGAIEVVVK